LRELQTLLVSARLDASRRKLIRLSLPFLSSPSTLRFLDARRSERPRNSRSRNYRSQREPSQLVSISGAEERKRVSSFSFEHLLTFPSVCSCTIAVLEWHLLLLWDLTGLFRVFLPRRVSSRPRSNLTDGCPSPSLFPLFFRVFGCTGTAANEQIIAAMLLAQSDVSCSFLSIGKRFERRLTRGCFFFDDAGSRRYQSLPRILCWMVGGCCRCRCCSNRRRWNRRRKFQAISSASFPRPWLTSSSF